MPARNCGRLMQTASQLLEARLLQTLFQDRQSLVERHAGMQQMRELLGEYEQLALRKLQVVRRDRSSENTGRPQFFWRRWFWHFLFRRRGDGFDSNRHAVLLLDLPDGDCAIGAIQNALDQCALRIARPIGKLWHRARK
jgi:hypothetical protein